MTESIRTPRGTFAPGSSGCPGGRPKSLEKLVREQIGPNMVKLTAVMEDIVMGRLPEGMNARASVSPRDRIEAYKVLCDRGWGKARVTIDLAADIVAGGVAGVDPDAMDLEAGLILDEAIARALDPAKRRASAMKDANPVAPAPALPILDVAPAQELEPAREPAPVLVQAQEPEPSVAVPVVRHVFRGSNNVAWAELDLTTKIVTVSFLGGGRYRFANFSESLLKDWSLAVSAGRWFNQMIRSRPEEHPPVGARM